MKIDLSPHPCDIYRFWSEWLKPDLPAAICKLDGRPPSKYFNSTAANRYRFAVNAGYKAYEMFAQQRNLLLDDIYDVNISLENRQGRPMKDSYREYPAPWPVEERCKDHYASFIGCFIGDTLVAYISTNYCGKLAAASQIIGHGDHLKNGCMLVLWAEFIRVCQEKRMDVIVYSRWGDGKQGLKYWKHSVGLKPAILREKERENIS